MSGEKLTIKQPETTSCSAEIEICLAESRKDLAVLKASSLSPETVDQKLKALWVKCDKSWMDFFDKEIPKLSPEIAQKFLFEWLDKDPNNAPFYFHTDIIANYPKGREIFMKLAQKKSNDCFSMYKKYKHTPWSSDILIEAAYYNDLETVERYLKNDSEIKNIPSLMKNNLVLSTKMRKDNELLVKVLLSRQLKDYETKYEFATKINKALEDPALRNIAKVNPSWLPVYPQKGDSLWELFKSLFVEKEKQYSNKEWNVYWQSMIARNLYFQKKEVNETNVKAEIKNILKMRKRYKNVPIFSGRNVVLAAHSEQKKSDKFGDLNRFGKQALVDRIRKDGGKIGEVLRPQNNLESLKRTKNKILEQIKTAKTPFTFVFEGHGGPDALYLSDGQAVVDKNKIVETGKTIKITVEDLFQAYNQRQKKFGAEQSSPEKRDIFVNGSCYSANFIRKFYLLCDKEDVIKPIFTGESEYGQYGYSEYRSKYGDTFYDNLFNTTPRATLGDIIENDPRNDNSNPSLYIPDTSNQTMQLSKQQRITSTSYT